LGLRPRFTSTRIASKGKTTSPSAVFFTRRAAARIISGPAPARARINSQRFAVKRVEEPSGWGKNIGGLADQPYRLLYGEVGSRWNWGRGRNAVQAVDDLRTALASDLRTHVLIAHGARDLVARHYANKLILDQLPLYGSPERAKLVF